MEFENVIIDPIHIFNKKKYQTKKFTGPNNIHLIVENKDTHELYYYIQKGKKYDPNTRNSFINYLEKSIELIHPSIINLSGYSIEKPYLYYKFSDEPLYINNIKMSDEIIQKIIFGLASGLSYLSSKGYYFTNFSFNSIIFDKKCSPKFIDYIEFDDKDKLSEKDMIIKYAELIEKLIKRKIDQDSNTSIDTDFKTLLERCKNPKNMPTFNDFILLFEKKSFRGNSDFILYPTYQRYIEILNQNKFILDEKISKKINNSKSFDSIEQVCFCFFRNRKTIKKLNHEQQFLLNSIPDYYLKQLQFFCNPLSKKLMRFTYNDDISLILPDWNQIYNSNSEGNSFEIYKELIKQMNRLEKQKDDFFYFDSKAKKINYKIEALRIQAIHFLKRASLQSVEAKIELAVQYIKGNLFAFNIDKAKKVLSSISNADKQKKTLINQMITKIESSLDSINKSLNDLQANQRMKFEKAENDVLYMLYVAFSLYTGFDDFPIIRSLSIQFYKKAAKKSPDAMLLLGFLYYNGIFFPQNLEKARKCFKCAADMGSPKGEIIDNLVRKHAWRTYLTNFSINELFNHSMIPNDSLAFSKINYFIENDLSGKMLLDLEMVKHNDNKISLKINEKTEWDKKVKPIFSEKIFLNETLKDTNDVIAKSFFNGENNYPINYTKASQFYKLAADNGDSEAQWRYALLCLNSIGIKENFEIVENYLQKSVKQNNLRAKFYYALFAKEFKKDVELFKKLIKDCCDSNDLNAIYYNAIYLEETKFLQQSIQNYKNVADQCHFDSLIQLINLLKQQSQEEESLYKDYLELSVGIFNEDFLLELIKIYDENKDYKKSSILIQIGYFLNYKKFEIYYIDYLLKGKGMDANFRRARKLAVLAFQRKNLSDDEREKIICLMLQILVNNNEHQKALDFLIQYRHLITEKSRDEFHLFYQKFDKKLAKFYFIPACFYYDQFKICHDLLLDLYKKNTNTIYCFSTILDYAQNKGNPFAMAILGNTFKHGIFTIRNLRKAIKFFAYSADKNCPLGNYYLGKEYYYGRYLTQNYKKAKEYLSSAIEHEDEPHAGYYLYKILRNDENNDTKIDPVEMVKIGAKYGHKKALYKYGQILYTGRFNVNRDIEEGIKLIQQACSYNYTKAKKFCVMHRISFKNHEKKFDSSINEDDSDFIIYTKVSKSSLNQSQTLNNFDLIELDENDKTDIIINNEKDDLSIESSSLNEESIINIEEDYYSDSQSEYKKRKNSEDKKNEYNLYNIRNDKNFQNLINNKDDESSLDLAFWDS